MNAQLFKPLIIFCSCVVVTCSHSYAFRGFPTEAEVNANLRSDMTTDQVVALFGEPFNGRPERCINCHFLYLMPSGMRTADREGYQGFEVQFDEGKVRNWRIFTGRPSYYPAAVGPPRAFKWWLISWPLMFIVAFIIAFVRGIPLAMNQRTRMLRAFVGMKISSKLPPEFAFISRDTTLREILERVGPCTGEVEFVVGSEEVPNYPLIRTKKGASGIRAFVYELPYGSPHRDARIPV